MDSRHMIGASAAGRAPPPAQAGLFVAAPVARDLLATDGAKRVAEIYGVLQRDLNRFAWHDNAHLHLLVRDCLNAAGFSATEADARLHDPRPGFQVGEVAIALRTSLQRGDHLAYLAKVAENSRALHLLVVTDCPWAFVLPRQMASKSIWPFRIRQRS